MTRRPWLTALAFDALNLATAPLRALKVRVAAWDERLANRWNTAEDE